MEVGKQLLKLGFCFGLFIQRKSKDVWSVRQAFIGIPKEREKERKERLHFDSEFRRVSRVNSEESLSSCPEGGASECILYCINKG